ncbi:type I polyketide synthase [Actinomadura verrucosospora]|uniref:Type I modular polyketide synthase n=1 Tax=Actinomadura verrucosospora TaxID=46165 RepID=A0A7D3VRA1_ACTVE|nr:type I polyketide synthase [Actinomadura verrucosospora]QKG21055.1 Type I modular polyketide synthase [Actinomadura verrucosospora]
MAADRDTAADGTGARAVQDGPERRTSATGPGTEIVGVTPFGRPAPHLAVAVARAGGHGVLDLGTEREPALAALADVRRWWAGRFGVRVPAGCRVRPQELPDAVGTVVFDAPALLADDSLDIAGFARGRRLLVEVVDAAEAAAVLPVAGGFPGTRGTALIARGREAGGRVGDLTTFVLLQRLLADEAVDVPVLAAGGIGPRTAAAAVAGGAAGVVLDVQLALVREMDLPADVAAALTAMDGSETRVVHGHRVYTRPDLPDIALADLTPAEVNARLGATGLRSRLLPAGQDAPLAAALAARHRTAGGVVQAVREGIAEHLRAAVQAAPLASRQTPDGPEYPVVQGPMTQVSDRSAFAAAVAQEGGVPFLALALMDGDRVRTLLRETADRLAGRPWGVGVLGFAPPEVREAQLDAVREAAPPYAIVSGGRPAQAASLEDAGVSAYLHVPSPDLLERFLAEGARKFVFEGQECGGHVGPRASFPLWEAQAERLMAFGGDPAELSVMFAGGIHDARSAAMVAALAGPLAERGADVRVLMGTAYLFTTEAVAAGAILPGFQKAAVDCGATALLETSPGHATRCARTPYVEQFTEARRELEAAGTPRQDMWRQLERLNLGRLRIASKGLRRSTPVGPDEQRAEGLYMIGDVAALRSSTTTVAALHDEVTDGATALLAARAADLGIAGDRAAASPAARPADIAIVGVGCVFPGARDADAYWANIVGGVDSVTEVPAERWDPAVHYDPSEPGKTPSKWGGFLPDVPFDALAYGIPPNALGSVEPIQLLALEVAARALKDAGYADRPFDRSRTSVFFGAEGGNELATAYGLRAALPSYYGEVPPGLDEQLPEPTEDSFPGVLTNVIAGRIANRLDLGGANYTVDAACAASLAALDAACKELAAGGSDMVLCGGADVHNGIQDYLMFSAVRALSPTGRCAPFDAAADGIALGEGVACVVLKRLADAERDGDRVYAVVKSVAGSSDGRSLGLTAPRAEGQRLALDRAYERAGVRPSDVGLVEAHGTGTEVGDRTELATLTDAFSAAAPGSVALGSVKSQIGHTKCAAGLAGLIKTAYALHTGVLPGTLHLTSPNPAWKPDGPFAFGTTARPWAARPGDRYAGVSGFGFGGANFHAVLAGYDGGPEPVSGLAEWPAELFLIRGADRTAARAEIARLRRLLDVPSVRLRDIARTCASTEGRVQVAVVATGPGDLRGKLAAAAEFRTAPGVHVRRSGDPGQVAFLFPGQGSQRPGMLAGLFVAFPRLQRLLRLAGGRYAPAMFPPAAFGPDDARRQREALTDTRVAQPALGIAGLAVHRLLTAVGVHPDLAAGHSYGELVALCAAGVFDDTDMIELSAARAEAILAAAGADPGAMAAVSAPLRQVRDAVSGVSEIVVANHNAPDQVVVSGTTAGVARALAVLAERGLAAERIPVACAFHSPLVAAASGTLRTALTGRDLRSPAFPVWSNTTAAPYDSDPADLAATLAGQIAAPVRFVEQIEAMYEAGARTFVEAGPGRVLTGLTRRILGDRPHTAVACDAADGGSVERLLHALAELAAAGVAVDPLPLFAGRDARVLDPASAPAAPGWIVNGHLVRTADGGYPAGALRPAERIPGTAAPARPAGSDAAVLEYLRAGRELIAAQREVILRHLGAAPAAPSAPAPVPAPRPVLPGETLSALPAAAEPPRDVHATVLAVISARTGYPESMLDADLDLEADLSIDSIKRTVIIGEVTERVGLTAPDAVIEQLTRITTIGGIVDWLRTRLPSAQGPQRPAVPPQASPRPGPSTHAGGPPAPRRQVSAPADQEGDAPKPSPKRTAAPASAGEQSGTTPEQPTTASAGGTGRRDLEASDAEGTRAAISHRKAEADGGRPAARSAAPVAEPPAGAGRGSGGAGGLDPEAVPDAGAARTKAEASDRRAEGDGGRSDARSAGERTPSGDRKRGPEASSSDAASRNAARVPSGEGDEGRRAAAPAGSAEEAPAAPGTEEPAGRAAVPPARVPDGEEAAAGGEAAAVEVVRLAGDGAAALGGEDAQRPAPAPAGRDGETTGARRVLAGRVRPSGERARRVVRQVVRTADLEALPVPADTGTAFDGRTFVVVDDGCGVALELADRLERYGARVRTPMDVDGPCDGLVHLAALRPGATAVLPDAYAGIRDALAGGLRWLVVASGAGGTFGRAFDGGGIGDPGPGAGLRGLAATVAQEYPDALVRAVDVDTKDTPRAIASRLLAELLDARGPVAVGHEGDLRRTTRLVPAELRGEARVPLDADGVVLLTGGARGVTARTALELARTTGCHIEVMGRTLEPVGPPSFPDVPDEAGLRRALVAQGGRRPAEIEATVRRIVAEREIRANLDALKEHAASVRYHAGDVREPRLVRDVVERVYLRHGRLDGVVHGAGVVEDRLVRDKEPQSFERVYRTKVDGASALAAAVRPDVGFFVVFGSVAGVHGNRGQADYAAANEACDTLAHVWRTRLRGRVLVADWGPWAGGGMVSPELAREYGRRGIGLIDPDAGVAALLREIAHGDETQVVLTGTVR